MANPLRFPLVMPCSQWHPIGFIVLREVMRNGGIYHIPVQWLHATVNHRTVHCVRLTVKIFMNFTRIDFKAEKLSCLCMARYGKAGLCTLLYAGFADSAANFTPCRELLHEIHRQNHILRMKLKNAVQSVQRVRHF